MFYPIVRTTALRACVERGHAALSDFPRKMLVKAFLCKRQVYTRIKSCFRCRSLRWTDAQFQGAQDSAWNGDSCLLARKPGIGLRAPTLRGGFILGTGVGLFFVSPFYERRNRPTLRTLTFRRSVEQRNKPTLRAPLAARLALQAFVAYLQYASSGFHANRTRQESPR